MDLLIDTNVIIDVLQRRSAFFDNSQKILQLCTNHVVIGCIAPHSFTNIFYILRKTHSQSEIRTMLKDLARILKIPALDKTKLISALNRSDFCDFEDCLQEECAFEMNVDYIVTRDKSDFVQSRVPVLSPEELLQLVG